MSLRICLYAAAFCTIAAVAAAHRTSTFNPRVDHWIEIPVPPKTPRATRAVWDYATNYSKHEWIVERKGGQVQARLEGDRLPYRPKFLPKDAIFEAVSDGWLVEFNRGEWGGKLVWYSVDGKQSQPVSNDQVVAFFRRGTDLFAVEGLTHMSISEGSVVKLERTKGKTRWKVTQVAKLPSGPYAVSVRNSGEAVITLSEGVAIFGTDNKVRTLTTATLWAQLYPNSSALSSDEKKLYIGMRQFVGEVDLASGRIRLLVPSKAFLNRLPPDEERNVRATYQ